MESFPTPPAPKPTKKLSNEIIAAIITGVFGLATVLITTVFPKVLPERSDTALPTSTNMIASTTTTPTTASTFAITTSPTHSSGLATDVILIGNLQEDQREIINAGYAAALELANKLPLMIRDEFDTPDYGWPESPPTEYETNFCEFKIGDGAYHMRIETKNSSGSCWTTAPRSAKNFLVSTDLSAAARKDLTNDILFRFQDWDNYFYLSIDTNSQQFFIGQYLDGKLTNLADWTEEKTIHKNGVNQVSIIGVGNQITMFINQDVVAGFTDPAPKSGNIVIRANLYETSSSHDLVIDNFILRGE